MIEQTNKIKHQTDNTQMYLIIGGGRTWTRDNINHQTYNTGKYLITGSGKT